MIPQYLPGGVLLRRSSPSDAAAVQALVVRSDLASRYSRFHGAVRRLPSGYLLQLVDRPALEHDTLVAEVDGQVVALADLGPVRHEPGVVEVGILVETAWRRRGLASTLLDELGARAARRGATVLRAVVLHERLAEVKPLFAGRPVLRSWTEQGATGFDLALDAPVRLPA